MANPVIQKSTLKFLASLEVNNNRDWFNIHKKEYLKAQENVCDFIDALLVKMKQHDEIENESAKKCLYRIYNDIRFSKDKTPYNPRFAFGLKRATVYKRGGYYTQLKPGSSLVGCGFFAPNPEDLKRIRLDIQYNYQEWYDLLNDPKLKNDFGELMGDAISTAPRGFDKNHPAIGLIRQKQFLFKREFTDAQVCSEYFLDEVNDLFKTIRPFFDYMSEVLTTNLNGEPVV